MWKRCDSAPDIRAVTAILNRSDIKQSSQYATAGGQVNGVEANYSVIRFLPIKEGRFLNDGDLRERRRVVVLGQKTAALLFPGHPALGDYVTLNGTRFAVIGVADKNGHGNNDNENQKVYIPLTTMLEMFPMKGENIPDDALTAINYQPRIRGESGQATEEAHAIVARRHGFDPAAPDAFNEWDTIKGEQMVGKIFTAMDVFLGGVGIVTLALGAVGIINIMLVSVSERTREIGLRKAIGATKNSILAQFFLEGLTLTSISGLIGIGGSALFMYVDQQRCRPQHAGLRSAAAGSVVCRAGVSFVEHQRRRRRTLSGQQSRQPGAGRSAPPRIGVGLHTSLSDAWICFERDGFSPSVRRCTDVASR